LFETSLGYIARPCPKKQQKEEDTFKIYSFSMYEMIYVGLGGFLLLGLGFELGIALTKQTP
jgi:hypothetical protein